MKRRRIRLAGCNMTKFRLGALEISRVEDFVDPKAPIKFLLPDLGDETISQNLDWLAPRFYDPSDGSVAIHIQSWLLRTRHHTILVDACVGNHKTRHFPPFHMRDIPYLDRLKHAGAGPDQIDYVFCTHLHSDHVGWNTRLDNGRWVPTFPNAKYLFSRADVEALDPRRGALSGWDDASDAFLDSAIPVIESGQAQILDGEHQVGDGMTILPAPGHTPGHCYLRVEDSGDSGLFTGDALHHPVQIAAPEVNSFACLDADAARATCVKVLEECCDQHRLLIPGHFAPPHQGRIARMGDGFRFLPGETF